MPRLAPVTCSPALVAALLAASLSVAAPAPAAPADYLPVRVFDVTDAWNDVAAGDLVRTAVQVDPTLGQATFFANVTDTTHDDAIVLGLGTPDASGSCQPSVEIVGGTRTTSWIVRNPGETTLPPPTTDYHPRVVVDGRLVGFEPTCYSVRTVDAAGTTLDGATDLTVRLVPVVERDLTLFASPNVLQERGGHAFSLHFAVSDPYVDAEQWVLNPLYGLDIELTPGPGVTLDATHITTSPGPDAYRPVGASRATVSAPGWHFVDVRATAGNGSTWRGRVYLWDVGGTHPPATGDLTGRGFHAHYLSLDGEGDAFPSNAELWFVNGRFATTSDLRSGLPTCRRAGRHCLRYWYEKETGIFQIGEWRGVLLHDGARWRPSTSSDDDATYEQEGQSFFDGHYDHGMLRTWSGRKIPPGTYRYVYREGETSTYRFASHHRYVAKSRSGQRSRGTYRLQGGRITFTSRDGQVTSEAFAVGADRSGRARPGRGFMIRNGWYETV